MTILRYFGKLNGLYPVDPIEAMQVDAMIDTLAESTKLLEMSVQGRQKFLLSEEPWSQEEVLEIRERISTDDALGLPFYLAFSQKTLEETGSGWLVGPVLAIADVQLHRVTSWGSMASPCIFLTLTLLLRSTIRRLKVCRLLSRGVPQT